MIYILRNFKTSFHGLRYALMTALVSLTCTLSPDFVSLLSDSEKVLHHFPVESARGIVQKAPVIKHSGSCKTEVSMFATQLLETSRHPDYSSQTIVRSQNKFIQGQIYASAASSFL